MDEIRIRVSGDSSALDPTIDKMEKMGQVDKTNAAQFKKTNSEFIDATKKRNELLEIERKNLEALYEKRKRAFNPEDIRVFNAAIKENQARVKELSIETEIAAGGFTSMIEGAKGLYGALRTVANILPGVGISTLILAGWELFYDVIAGTKEQFKGLEEAIGVAKKAMNALESDARDANDALQKTYNTTRALLGEITDEEKAVKDLRIEEKKRIDEVDKKRLEYAQELAKTLGITKATHLEGGGYQIEVEKKAYQFREKIALEFQNKMIEYDKVFEKERKDIIQNTEFAIINIVKDAENKKAKEVDKQRKADFDRWWKDYLKWLTDNFEEALRLYKKDTSEFLKHEKEKWEAAVKRNEDNIKLIIDNDILEASLTETKIDDENASYQQRLENFKIQYDEKGVITEQSQRHLELLEKQHQKNLTDITEKETEKRNKKVLDDIKTFTQGAIDLYEKVVKVRIEGIDHMEERQKESIEIQTRLAEAGRKNTLGEELKRQSDLEKARMHEQKKLMKAKELETFLNSVAEYSKTDPKTAVMKAIAQLALVKGAEALYMEDGGFIDDSHGPRSRIGMSGLSRRHRSGKDVLVHAEVGEGMFNKTEVKAMGGKKGFMAFKAALANPMKELPFKTASMGVLGIATKGIEDGIKSLEKTVRDKPETQIDFEGLYMIVTRTEKGVTTKTKYVPRNIIGG